MKLLELFCGTKSITKAFQKNGFNTITLDIDNKFNPDIHIDILNLDYRSLGNFDVIWASPPCSGFSVASIGAHWGGGNKQYIPITKTAELGIALVLKSIEIINYIEPNYWFIENPVGLLRKMPFMNDMNRNTIWYCQYNDERAKPTDIWYKKWPTDMPIRKCRNQLKGKLRTCHHILAPRGAKSGTQGRKNSIERARIPDEFCELLANSIINELME